jgi:hypothetical protein
MASSDEGMTIDLNDKHLLNIYKSSVVPQKRDSGAWFESDIGELETAFETASSDRRDRGRNAN